MIYPIVIYPNNILTRENKQVNEITDELIDLLDDMRETMKAHDGVGLAAPQIGKNIQVAVVEISDEFGGLFELINPEILISEGTDIDLEGCLSFPEIYGTVERAETVKISYYDREGDQMEVTASGYLARVFQHEIEHLAGKLFTEKIIERIAPENIEAYYAEEEDQDD